jgi:ADP-heptose:LPS heptosyltransferase
MRVVALVPGGIGEQILFFPTLDDFKRNYPDVHVDVVTEPRSKAAYRVSQSISEILTFDFQDRNSLADWVNLVGTLREREYDVAITTGQNWFVGLILWLAGIPVRIGYKAMGNAFLTSSVPLSKEQYAALTYHDLLKGLGINSACRDLAISVPKLDIDWAESEQKRLGVHETGYILVHGGVSELAHKELTEVYPVENWQQIIRGIQQKQPEMPVLTICQANEHFFTVPNLKITSPEDIGKLAAIIAGANLLICDNNAVLQLAVAVQTYTIALFGNAEPKTLLPNSDRFLAIKSPTGKIADISPETVLQKI